MDGGFGSVPVAGATLFAGFVLLRWCVAGEVLTKKVMNVLAIINAVVQNALKKVGVGGLAALVFGRGVLFGQCGEEKALPGKAANKKKTLVLDLDDTLVHCFVEPPAWYEHFHLVKFVKKTVLLNQQRRFGTIHVGLRPHLGIFLAEACKLFDLVVYTAAEKSYADAIIEAVHQSHQIDSVHFRERFYRDSCRFLNGTYLKDLSLLQRGLDRVAILDDNPGSYAMQPSNGIPIKKWSGNPWDRDLLDLIPLLYDIHRADDARQVLAL